MKITHIHNINDLATEFINMQGPWVYRGQRDSTWELEPSIARILPDGFSNVIAHRLEKTLKGQFEASAIHFASSVDLPSTPFGWLSLMQHHSAPTRLLDFTESPFMALFFAMDGVVPSKAGSSSIIAVNYRELNKRSLEITRERIMDFSLSYEEFMLSQDKHFTDFIYKNTHETLWIMDPLVKNQRMLHQKGTFLVKGSIATPTKNIIDQNYSDIPMRKIVLSHELLTDAFDILGKCGISYQTIYPGLDGLGKDMSLTLLQSYRKASSPK